MSGFKILRRIGLDFGVSVQIIDTEENTWVRVFSDSILWFFSCEKSSESAVKQERFIRDLVQRLGGAGGDVNLLYSALEVWPEGWINWGTFVPEPISGFAETTSFFEELSKVEEERMS